ncbi:MAG: mechanosensitive ion channel family protein [Acetobacteraceae bacterium]|nr:mechanosensitive ion channel family protein [Acetobacteraceae bacterium]
MHFDLTEAFASLQGLVTSFLERLPYIIIAIVVYALFHITARTVRRVLRHFAERRRKHMNVGLVLGRLAEGGIMLLGILVALVIAIPSFQPAQLIQLLGISGVAIGFAFRDILQNFLAGLLILLTEPFKINDQIVVGSFEGTVEEIETRATTIRTYDGRRVVIPNSNLFTQSVVVNTAFSKRRLQYDVGIGYGDDIARAKDVILGALRRVHGVLDDPAPEALIVGLADFSVTVRARWWISPPRRADLVASTDDALQAIKNALTEAGIDLPFPTRQILFHDQTETSDGDRARQREGWPAGKGEVPGSRAIGGALLHRRADRPSTQDASP